VVRVEPGAGLAPEADLVDQALLDRRRTEPVRTAETLVHGGCNGEVDVDPDQIHQLERAHRVAGRSDRRIGFGDARLPGLEHPQRLDGERPVDAVDDEPRRVRDDHRRLAPALHQRGGPRDGIGAGLWRANDLDERHQRGRVEKMKAEHMVRPVRRFRDRRHRQRTGIRGQDRFGGRLPIERAEDRPLEAEILDGRLDRDVSRRSHGVQRHCRAQGREPTLDPGIDRIRVELELRRAPPQPGPDPLDATVERLLVDVVEDDLVARLERDLGDPGAHRPSADDTDDGAGEIVGPVRFVHGLTVRQRASGLARAHVPERGTPSAPSSDASPRSEVPDP
jgi:hypothetical protein